MSLGNTSKSEMTANQLLERCCRYPWEVYTEPFLMAPGVYYISGNDWVACYLIDTGDGLILIDTAMHETVYLMLENIYKLGYKPTDIKKILLTHAHIDHIGGARTMKEITGAKLYLGARDLEFLHRRRDLINVGEVCNYTMGEFEPNELFDDGQVIVQGNIVIHTIATPGHTPGCTSMFFDVKDKNNRVLKCGIHGGIGLGTLTREYFDRMNQPVSLRDEYIDGLKRLDYMDVDICLPSHTHHVSILPLVAQITEDYNPFFNPNIWHQLMQGQLQQINTLIQREP